MTPWYETLRKPPLTPPNWIFGPVWTVLYILIGLVIYLYLSTPIQPLRSITTAILVLHLVANLSWSFLFFRCQSPGWALMDILVLDVTLIFLIISFWQVYLMAAILLMPYLIWVLFATYLNYAIFRLN